MSLADRRATNLRDALDVDQGQMGTLLGVNQRTIARMEAAECSGCTIPGPLGAALFLLEQVALTRLPATLLLLAETLPADYPSTMRDADMPAWRAALERAVATVEMVKGISDGAPASLQRVVELLPERARARAWSSLTLGELLEAAWGKGRPWVYWATSAGTSAERTRELANEQGVIARSLSSGQPGVLPYLFKLRPGDLVLLCHEGRPLDWYRLVEADLPDSGGLEGAKERHLPSVFRVIKPESALGKALAADGYPRFNGKASKPGTGLHFTALAVERLDPPPYAEPPEPRRAG